MTATDIRLIRVTDETTRDEIVQAIELLCADAKKVSRCGAAAMLAPEYARTHRRIDALCCELETHRACRQQDPATEAAPAPKDEGTRS